MKQLAELAAFIIFGSIIYLKFSRNVQAKNIVLPLMALAIFVFTIGFFVSSFGATIPSLAFSVVASGLFSLGLYRLFDFCKNCGSIYKIPWRPFAVITPSAEGRVCSNCGHTRGRAGNTGSDHNNQE